MLLERVTTLEHIAQWVRPSLFSSTHIQTKKRSIKHKSEESRELVPLPSKFELLKFIYQNLTLCEKALHCCFECYAMLDEYNTVKKYVCKHSAQRRILAETARTYCFHHEDYVFYGCTLWCAKILYAILSTWRFFWLDSSIGFFLHCHWVNAPKF